MSILLGVVLLFAVLSGVVAAVQATAINRVAAAGEWRGWLFGWWRFDEIRQRAGLSASAQAGIYKRAVIACVVFVLFGLVLSGWALNQRNALTAVIDYPSDLRMPSVAHTEFSHLRPVAPMPGATSLES